MSDLSHPRVWQVALLASLLSTTPCAGQTPGAAMRATDRRWLGCWGIHMRDSLPGLRRDLLIHLDSTPSYRGSPPGFYGTGLGGFWAERDSTWLSWSAPAPESLVVGTIGLGGYVWRFREAGAVLVGDAYETYDVVDAVTHLGGVSARREPCPR
jgi:hypothetical protein